MANQFTEDQVSAFKEAFTLFDKDGDDGLAARLEAVDYGCTPTDIKTYREEREKEGQFEFMNMVYRLCRLRVVCFEAAFAYSAENISNCLQIDFRYVNVLNRAHGNVFNVLMQSRSSWAEDGERLGRGRSASWHRKSGWEEDNLTDRGWAGNKIVVRGRKWDSESGGSRAEIKTGWNQNVRGFV
ncbi:hypothetical protein ACFE04_016076 [Oxalis oulophora]